MMFTFLPKRRAEYADRISQSTFRSLALLFFLGLVTTGCSQSSDSGDSNQSNGGSKNVSVGQATKFFADGNVDKADEIVRGLLISDPDDSAAMKLMRDIQVARGDVAGAIETIDRLGELSPKQKYKFEMQAAALLLQEKRAADAIPRLRALLTRSPRKMDARVLYAKALDKTGNYFDANEQVRYLMKIRSVSLDQLLSLVHPDLSEHKINDLERMTEANRARLGVLNVARTYRKGGEPGTAMKILKASSEFKSNHPAVLAAYGHALATSQDFVALRNWLAQAPKACHRYLDFWLACGELAINEEPKVATACYLNAIRCEPSSVKAYYGIISAFEKTGDRRNAETFRERVAQVDQLRHDVVVLYNLDNPTRQMFISVSEKLASMGRLVEAIAWQEISLLYAAPNSLQLKSIPILKRQVLDKRPDGIDTSVVMCGIQSDSLPSATEWLASQKVAEPGSNPDLKGLERLPSSPVDTPAFKNVAQQRGIQFQYRNAAEPVLKGFRVFESLGAGAACFDFDLDGNVDVYLCQAACDPLSGAGQESNALFRGSGTVFSNVISESGSDDRSYSTGITAGDWNQDGFADLLVANIGINRLLINQGDGTFVVHSGYSSSAEAMTSSVAIADVSGDALADLVEVNYIDDNAMFDTVKYDEAGHPILPAIMQFKPGVDRVLETQDDGGLRPKPLGGQTVRNSGAGLGLVVSNIDNQASNEIFVANDMYANQYWSHNLKTDKWNDLAILRGNAYGPFGAPNACMGVAVADFDSNGKLDLHVSNFADEWANQFMQSESGFFRNAVTAFNLESATHDTLGFGTQAIDYNNDSHWDLMVGNGHIADYSYNGTMFKMPTQMLVRVQDGFVEQKVQGDDDYWNGRYLSRAMAKCDFNRDGRTDIVISKLQSAAALLENQTVSDNRWLQIELIGTKCERDAIGATATITMGSKTRMQVMQTGDGYMAKNESMLAFGVGNAPQVDQLEIRWPSGDIQKFDNLKTNKRYLVIQNNDVAWARE